MSSGFEFFTSLKNSVKYQIYVPKLTFLFVHLVHEQFDVKTLSKACTNMKCEIGGMLVVDTMRHRNVYSVYVRSRICHNITVALVKNKAAISFRFSLFF